MIGEKIIGLVIKKKVLIVKTPSGQFKGDAILFRLATHIRVQLVSFPVSIQLPVHSLLYLKI